MHLVAAGIDFIDGAYPGLPYLAVGHNRHIAWGTTATMTDNSYLFIEKLNTDNAHQVLFQRQWVEMPSTRREPIITPLFPGLTETLALQRMGVQEGLTYGSIGGFTSSTCP